MPPPPASTPNAPRPWRAPSTSPSGARRRAPEGEVDGARQGRGAFGVEAGGGGTKLAGARRPVAEVGDGGGGQELGRGRGVGRRRQGVVDQGERPRRVAVEQGEPGQREAGTDAVRARVEHPLVVGTGGVEIAVGASDVGGQSADRRQVGMVAAEVGTDGDGGRQIPDLEPEAGQLGPGRRRGRAIDPRGEQRDRLLDLAGGEREPRTFLQELAALPVARLDGRQQRRRGRQIPGRAVPTDERPPQFRREGDRFCKREARPHTGGPASGVVAFGGGVNRDGDGWLGDHGGSSACDLGGGSSIAEGGTATAATAASGRPEAGRWHRREWGHGIGKSDPLRSSEDR